MLKFEETNRTLEIEVKAHRATIDQMTNQLQSFDRNHYGHRYQIDVIKAERDAALNDKENLKHELETVKSRLDSIQKAWQNARGELDQRETRFSSTELHFKQIENDLTYTKSCFEAFKQQISQLLSDGYVKVEAKEDEIKEKIRLLMQSSKDRGIVSQENFSFLSTNHFRSFRLLQIYKIKKNNLLNNFKINSINKKMSRKNVVIKKVIYMN